MAALCAARTRCSYQRLIIAGDRVPVNDLSLVPETREKEKGRERDEKKDILEGQIPRERERVYAPCVNLINKLHSTAPPRPRCSINR